MVKASLVLSLAALGLAAVLGWQALGTRAELDRLHGDLEAVAGLETRLRALEADLAGPTTAPPTLVTGLGAAPSTGESTEGGALATPPVGRPLVVPARLADLEQRLTALEGKALAEEHAGPLSSRPSRLRVAGAGGGPYYVSLEDAKEDLVLTEGQTGEFERILADARRDSEALRRLPDDEGKTWDQAQRDSFQASDGAFRLDFTKVEAFRKKVIPGRSETYEQADRRIRDEAKRRLRDTLSTAQQDKFDKATIDPLLGGAAGGATFMTFGATISVPSDDSSETPAGR